MDGLVAPGVEAGVTWTHHHSVALCVDCAWTSETESSPSMRLGGNVVRKGKEHARNTGHYVQIERGLYLHINSPRRDQ